MKNPGCFATGIFHLVLTIFIVAAGSFNIPFILSLSKDSCLPFDKLRANGIDIKKKFINEHRF